MLKRAVIFLIIVSTISNCFMQLLVYSSYTMNKEYITSVFCINKDHPEVHCDGQCFLAKKLKDLEGKNKQVQDNLKRITEAQPQFQVLNINVNLPYFIINTNVGYLEKPTKNSSISIFHPPKLA